MSTVGFQDSQKSFSLSLEKTADGKDELLKKVLDYKYHNPEDVEELKKFIQDVLGEAESTAQERLDKMVSIRSDELVSGYSLISDVIFIFLSAYFSIFSTVQNLTYHEISRYNMRCSYKTSHSIQSIDIYLFARKVYRKIDSKNSCYIIKLLELRI